MLTARESPSSWRIHAHRPPRSCPVPCDYINPCPALAPVSIAGQQGSRAAGPSRSRYFGTYLVSKYLPKSTSAHLPAFASPLALPRYRTAARSRATLVKDFAMPPKDRSRAKSPKPSAARHVKHHAHAWAVYISPRPPTSIPKSHLSLLAPYHPPGFSVLCHTGSEPFPSFSHIHALTHVLTHPLLPPTFTLAIPHQQILALAGSVCILYCGFLVGSAKKSIGRLRRKEKADAVFKRAKSGSNCGPVQNVATPGHSRNLPSRRPVLS